jgi:hypothetical protein
MVFVRRHLSWVIGAWLACQVAGIAAAPVTFCCKGVPTSHDETECCPGLEPGQVCPMHHTVAGKRECKMRNAAAPADAALMSLAGVIGLVPADTSAVNAFELREVVGALTATAIRRTTPPDSPPPRA